MKTEKFFASKEIKFYRIGYRILDEFICEHLCVFTNLSKNEADLWTSPLFEVATALILFSLLFSLKQFNFLRENLRTKPRSHSKCRLHLV